LAKIFKNKNIDPRFKQKYHPEESAKRRAELKSMLTKRVDVYMEFFDKKMIEQVPFDSLEFHCFFDYYFRERGARYPFNVI
jgi:hypothetical protein